MLLCGLLCSATVFASVKIKDTNQTEMGDVHTIVGNWTKQDEVTAILPEVHVGTCATGKVVTALQSDGTVVCSTATGGQPTTGIFCGGTLSTTMNCENFRGRIPIACTPVRVDLTVTTAPTGAALIVDVNECSAPGTCTTVFTTQANRPQIAAAGLSGSSTTFDDTVIALGNYLSFDLDQVGSTVAGSNLTVTVVCE